MTEVFEATEVFEPTNRRGRVRCKVCGRSGAIGERWFRECAGGHHFQCGICGRRFATAQGRGSHHRNKHYQEGL